MKKVQTFDEFINERSIDKEKVYIEYLNKDKKFRPDKKYFDTYDKAVTWGRKNIERFNMDMIHYVINEIKEDDGKLITVISVNDPKQSKELQKKLFQQGYEWALKGQKISHTSSNKISIWGDKTLGYGDIRSIGYDYKKTTAAKYLKENINEAKGYEGEADSPERIIDLIHELPDSIHSLKVPISINNKETEDFVPNKNKNWKDDASDIIKDLVKKEGKNLSFKLKSHFGKGGKNEPYYILIQK